MHKSSGSYSAADMVYVDMFVCLQLNAPSSPGLDQSSTGFAGHQELSWYDVERKEWQVDGAARQPTRHTSHHWFGVSATASGGRMWVFNGDPQVTSVQPDELHSSFFQPHIPAWASVACAQPSNQVCFGWHNASTGRTLTQDDLLWDVWTSDVWPSIFCPPASQMILVETDIGIALDQTFAGDVLGIGHTHVPSVSSVFRPGVRGFATIVIQGEATADGTLPQLIIQAGGSIGCFQDDLCYSLTIMSTQVVVENGKEDSHTPVAAAAAVQVWGSKTSLVVSGTEFLSCYSSGDGGCIHAVFSQVNITNSLFVNATSAKSGGAIAAFGCLLSVMNSHFFGCGAGFNGGAVHASAEGSRHFSRVSGLVEIDVIPSAVELHACLFVRCRAGHDGGGVFIVDAVTNLTWSQFAESCGGGNGGGICSHFSSLFVLQNTFHNNTAGRGGGAVYFRATKLDHVPNFNTLLNTHSAQFSSVCGKDIVQGLPGGNRAKLFGNCIASSSWHLKTDMLAIPELFNESIGLPAIEITYRVSIYDIYEQWITSDSNTRIEVSSCAQIPGGTQFLQLDSNVQEEGPKEVHMDAIPQTMVAGKTDITVKLGLLAHYSRLRVEESGFANGTLSLVPARSQEFCFIAHVGEHEIIASKRSLTVQGGRHVCPRGHVLFFTRSRSLLGMREESSLSAEFLGACRKCPEAKYSINPIFSPSGRAPVFDDENSIYDLCLPCPAGATCAGGSRFQRKLAYAVWVETDYLWKLNACPDGYRMLGSGIGEEYELQDCAKCPEGKYILNSSDPLATCNPCPTGAQCNNGRPPVFNAVTGGLEITGVDLSQLHARLAVRQVLASHLGVSPGDVQLTIANLARTARVAAQGRRTRRERALQVVPRSPATQLGGRRRVILQTVTFEVSSMRAADAEAIVNAFESGEWLARAMMTSLFAQGLNASVIVTSVPTISTQSILAEGEVWALGEDGYYRLQSCPPGTLLVNHDGPQACIQCDPETYTISEWFGCSGRVCSKRLCITCPAGLECLNGVATPRTNNSLWVEEHHHWRIASCPPGHLLNRAPADWNGSRAEVYDKCLRCPPNSYSTERAHHNFSSGGPNLNVFGEQSKAGLCLTCPLGGMCDGGSSVIPTKGYWKGSRMLCRVGTEGGQEVREHCRKATSDDANLTRSTLWRRRDDERQWRVVEELYRCLPRMCNEWNVSSGTNCAPGHKGVACATCLQGFAMNKGICVSCNNAQEGAETSKADRTIAEVTTFYVGPIVAGIFVMILWYVLAWRPLCLVSCAWEERVFLCALAFTNFPIISTAKRLFANMCQAKGGGEISSAYLQTLFKILAGFLQVLGSFEITFEVDWPAIFDKMWAIASVFQVDLWSMPNAACFFVDASYFDKLRLQTVLPVVVVAAFGLPSAVAAVLGTCFHGGACNFPNWREITAKFDSSVMLFLFLVYPSISGVVLRALHCRDFGPDGSLLVDDHTGNIAFLYAAKNL